MTTKRVEPLPEKPCPYCKRGYENESRPAPELVPLNRNLLFDLIYLNRMLDDSEALTELICSKFGIPARPEVSEENIYRIIAEAAEKYCVDMTPLGEEITRAQAKAIAEAFCLGEFTK